MTKGKFILLFLLPYVSGIIFIVVALMLGPVIYSDLSIPQELIIAEFPFKFEVSDVRRPIISSNLNPPFRIAKRQFPKINLQAIAPPPSAMPSITLVMLSENTRIAIINGLVLKEGDILGNGRILRIRNDAVVISQGERLTEIPIPQP